MPSRAKAKGPDTRIATLGPAKIESPLTYCHFVPDDMQIPIRVSPEDLDEGEVENDILFEPAGPRATIYFDSSKVKAARQHLFRFLQGEGRHRHLRRAVPRHQRRDQGHRHGGPP